MRMAQKFQLVFFLIAVLSSNVALAENDAEERFKFKDYKYYDETLQKWFYKVLAGGRGYLILVNEDDGSASCPLNSILEDVQVGVIKVCKCDKQFAPSPDMRHCIPARLRLESCHSSNPCAVQMGLKCRDTDRTCQCPKDAVWDEQDGVCYSGEICRSILNFGTVYDPTSPRKCVRPLHSSCELTKTEEENACPLNSHCTKREDYPIRDDARCKCNKGFIYENQISCNKVGNAGDSCSSGNVTCSEGLSCINNNTVCGCENNLVYDQIGKVCRIGAGTGCSTHSWPSCTRYSECGFEGHRNQRMTCKCNTGYKKMENGLCLGEHMSSCRGEGDCEPGLDCIDGSCNCPAPINQAYMPSDNSEHTNPCRNLIDSTCNATSTCLPNSECILGTCKCNSGYSKAWNRHCLKSYEAECRENECNLKEGLACNDGVCICIDPGLKFVNGSGCMGKVGSPCGSLQAVEECGQEKVCKKYFVSCEPPASCNSDGQCELAQNIINNRIPRY